MKTRILFGVAVLLSGFYQMPTLMVEAQAETANYDHMLEKISPLMNSMITTDAAVEEAWLDYQSMLSNVEFWDALDWKTEKQGASWDDMINLFTPDATLTEDYPELSYRYETESLQTLEINLLFNENTLYYSEIVAIPTEFTDEMLVSIDDLGTFVKLGFPTMDPLLEVEPHVFGVANMVKDGLLGTTVSFASGSSMEEDGNLEFLMFLDEKVVESIYYTTPYFTEFRENDMGDFKQDLFYYAYNNYHVSPVLSELVNMNSSSNDIFIYDSQQLAEWVDYDFDMLKMDTGTQGEAIDTVVEMIDTQIEGVRESMDEKTERITYTFTDENDPETEAILSLIFVDGELASIINRDNNGDLVDGNWMDYMAQPLLASDIPVGETITPLVTTSFDVYAVATVALENGYHQAFLSPVETESGDIVLAVIDVQDYYVESINYLESITDYSEVDYLLYDYLASQYNQ
ncbi:hypothetical protein [Fundicoccus culcitae]|uniref:Uncharacterized protein n=1 Tax=Fundicoccus culcitae TaxID=2969821 RepID=A0ABY5P3F7_9LACT|nr:hypothetical protein [Fundicoccus culcitae]UUX33104.1 hypothetical protein NRE15_09305 [Fundicoccus culcitae]